jgi:hypothetical protein
MRPERAFNPAAKRKNRSTAHRKAQSDRLLAEKLARPARTILAPDQSAELRERLLADIGQLQSSDEAADWVHNNLGAKNTLVLTDADAVEAAFRDTLATIEAALAAHQGKPQSAPAEESAAPVEKPLTGPMDNATAAPIIPPGTSGTRRRRVAAKTIRLRDKEHCKFVASQPGIVCGRMPTEAHHIRFAQPRALGRKVSDEYTVPVYRLHHRELHTAMKPHGGPRSALTRCPSRSNYGADRIPTSSLTVS